MKFTATSRDIELIDLGIKHVWDPKLDFIFKDKKRISGAIVVSYDSDNLYLWEKSSEGNSYNKSTISHNERIEDEHNKGWSAYLRIQNLYDYLPDYLDWQNKSKISLPIISGGLFSQLSKIQRELKRQNNPYTTEESYLATIVHEFGHVYFNSYIKHFFSNKKRNLNYIKTAIDLYDNRKISDFPDIWLPENRSLSEIFAFCADYSASKIFWPSHVSDINKSNRIKLSRLYKEEGEINLDKKDSVMHDPHISASILGKIILEKYPENWMDVLIQKNYYS